MKNVTKLVNNARKANKALINNKITDIHRKVSPGISYCAIALGSIKNTPGHREHSKNSIQDNLTNTNNSTDYRTPPRQDDSNDLPPWVNILKHELLNIVNSLASIGKQLDEDNERINHIFEILECQAETT